MLVVMTLVSSLVPTLIPSVPPRPAIFTREALRRSEAGPKMMAADNRYCLSPFGGLTTFGRLEVCYGLTLLPLFAAMGGANAAEAGKVTVGSAPTPEGEAAFNAIYQERLAAREKEVKAMGFELDDDDRKELENLLRTSFCGFQAKLKCAGSPVVKGGYRPK